MVPKSKNGTKKINVSAVGQAPVAGGNSKHNIFIHEIRIIKHFEL